MRPTPAGPWSRLRGFRCRRDQVYAQRAGHGALRLDLYLPLKPRATPCPAVLVVHGGAWCSGERWQIGGVARRLVRAGYVVANATYRLAPAHVFPAPVEDLQEALRWLHAQADTYGIDPTRIAAWGYSAGAHLVSMLGVLDAGDPLFDPALRLRAIVAGGTPADLRLFGGGKLVRQFVGVRYRDAPRRYAEASPAARVHGGMPPTFLYHGSRDRLVPPAQARALLEALQSRRIEHEVCWLRGRGHAGGYLLDGPARQPALAFLARHLA